MAGYRLNNEGSFPAGAPRVPESASPNEKRSKQNAEVR